MHLSLTVPIFATHSTGWRRRRGCRIFVGHFLQKSSIISGSFAKKDRMSYLHSSTWHDRNPYVFKLYIRQFPIFATHSTGWRRRRGCLIFVGHFLQKSSIISGSFAKKEIATGWRRRRGCRIFLTGLYRSFSLQVFTGCFPYRSFRAEQPYNSALRVKIRHPMALCRPAEYKCRVVWREMTSQGTWPVQKPFILRVKIQHPMALCRISINIRHPMALYRSFSAKQPYN